MKSPRTETHLKDLNILIFTLHVITLPVCERVEYLYIHNYWREMPKNEIYQKNYHQVESNRHIYLWRTLPLQNYGAVIIKASSNTIFPCIPWIDICPGGSYGTLNQHSSSADQVLGGRGGGVGQPQAWPYPRSRPEALQLLLHTCASTHACTRSMHPIWIQTLWVHDLWTCTADHWFVVWWRWQYLPRWRNNS